MKGGGGGEGGGWRGKRGGRVDGRQGGFRVVQVALHCFSVVRRPTGDSRRACRPAIVQLQQPQPHSARLQTCYRPTWHACITTIDPPLAHPSPTTQPVATTHFLH